MVDFLKKILPSPILSFGFLVILLLVWFWRFQTIETKSGGLEGEVEVEGFIWDEPKVFYSTQRFWLKGYLVETSAERRITAGDRVSLVGREDCQPTGKHRERCLIDYPDISLKKDSAVSELIRAVIRLRKALIASLERVLPSEAASLLTGIVWGNQGQFSKRFYEDMKLSGLLHVVVASGANVMTLVSLLKRAGGVLGRKITVFISLLLIVFYGFLVGGDPPIVRAVLMSSLVLVSGLIGRQVKPLRSLFLTGGLMMVFSPKIFLDISFQLSFGATLGILLFSKKLEAILHWSGLSIALAAQTITAPILAFYFDQLSPFSFISNALMLWLIEPLMIWGLVLTFLGLVSTFLARLVGIFFWFPLQSFIWGGRFWAQVLPSFTASSLVILLTLLLIPLVWLFLKTIKINE